MRSRYGMIAVVCLTLGACDGPGAETVTLTIPSGAFFPQVVDTLVARGVLGGRRGFSVYSRLRGADREIRSGSYELRLGEDWSVILRSLTEGRVVTTPLTIPEGFTIRDMVPRLAGITEKGVSDVEKVLTAADAAAAWSVPGPTLEGYLFPDTYRFAAGVSVENVVGTMVDRYEEFWTDARRAILDTLGLSERELVTLASIVQAEARRTEEMPVIAAVYHNRLRIGYLLQADPTVLYALGGRRERLLFAAIDSVADNPYNTYTQPGLPPGPIGSPGADALDAALHPADHDFLYFVARPNGTHIFTRSLQEHNRARRTARDEWDRDTTSPTKVGSTGGGP